MKHLVSERFWCIKQFDIFRDFAEADADALAQITTFKRFKTDESLCGEGVYLLKEGRVKIYETPIDDAEPVTLEVLEPGEMFGAVAWEEDNRLPNVTAETITAAVVGIVSVRNFLFFLKRKPHLVMPVRNQFNRFIRRLRQFAQRLIKRWKPVRAAYFSQHVGHEKPIPRQPAITNKLSHIAFRSSASRLAFLLQNHAMPPLPNGTVWTCKFSTKTFSRLIGSSEEKIEELLEQFQRHYLIKKRFRRIQILDMWQLKKIANSRMSTLPRTPQVPSTEQAEVMPQGERTPSETMQVPKPF